MGNSLDMLLDRLTGVEQTVNAIQEGQIETARLQARLRGKKRIIFKFNAGNGTNPFTAGGDAAVASGGIVIGPDAGYKWALRGLVIEGMTSSATPDILKIRVGSATGRLLWQLNGNSFGQTWGSDELPLNDGEFLFFQSVGTFNATGAITINGWADQVPGEMAGEFF